MTYALIAQFAGPAAQLLLVLALMWVGILFMRVDSKLTKMKRGTDGVRNTIIDLNKAVENAREALAELKTDTSTQIEDINEKIAEAQKMVEGFKFLQSVQKNLRPTDANSGANTFNPRGAEPKGLPPIEFAEEIQPSVNRRELKSRFDDDEFLYERDRPHYARRKSAENLRPEYDSYPSENSRRTNWGGLR